MQNFFVDRNITDPEGATLTVTRVFGRNMTTVPMVAGGVDVLPNCSPLTTEVSSAVIRVYPNGDYELVPNGLENSQNEFTLTVEIEYTDGTHTQTGVVGFETSKAANQPPVDPNPTVPFLTPVVFPA